MPGCPYEFAFQTCRSAAPAPAAPLLCHDHDLGVSSASISSSGENMHGSTSTSKCGICGQSLCKQRLGSGSAHPTKQTRRQLRAMNRKFTMKEVSQHRYCNDAWIVVNGMVYDISEHVVRHPGWNSAAMSTVLSIMSHVGTDCTSEFAEIHKPYPEAWRQLKAYYIGELDHC